jgi:ribonuclease P/MRP protein subunit RPP1
VIQSYDIIALQPTSEKLLQQACSSLDFDIIVLAGGNRQEFPLRVPTIKLALDKGIHFEISYAPTLTR